MNAILFIGGGIGLTMGCFAYDSWVNDAEAQARFEEWKKKVRAKVNRLLAL